MSAGRYEKSLFAFIFAEFQNGLYKKYLNLKGFQSHRFHGQIIVLYVSLCGLDFLVYEGRVETLLTDHTKTHEY